MKPFITKLLLLSLVSVAIVRGDDWPCFRGNQQRTGTSVEKVGIPFGGPVWQRSLGCNIVSSPSVADSLIYIGGRDSNVYALEVESGKVRWKYKTRGWVDGSPLIHKGRVIAGSRDGKIYALDKASGDSLFAWEAGLQLSSPGVSENSAILSGFGPPISGFGSMPKDPADENWFVNFGQPSYSSPANLSGRAVIGANNGKLYGIDLGKRDTLWSLGTEGGGYLSTPAIRDSIAYFAPGNLDRNVYAVNTAGGGVLWKNAGSLNRPGAKIAAGMKNPIHPDLFMKLLRLNPESREKKIQQLRRQGFGIPKSLGKRNAGDNAEDILDFYAYGDMKTSSVAVDSENVYVIQQELGYPEPRFSLTAFNKKSGNEIWFFAELRDTEKLGYCSSPIVADGKVFFGWGEGKVYAVSAVTGEKLWEDSLSGPIVSSPAISNGILYFATFDGTLVAYDLHDTPQPQNFVEGTFCYPNPARTISRIQYFLSKPGHVDVRLYDESERLVKSFRAENLPAGTKGRFEWNLTRVTNGVYFAMVEVQYDDGTKDQKRLKIGVLR